MRDRRELTKIHRNSESVRLVSDHPATIEHHFTKHQFVSINLLLLFEIDAISKGKDCNKFDSFVLTTMCLAK